MLSMASVCVTASIPSQSQEINHDSILVDVVVLPNGRINVTYWITITVTSGSLGGFDLLGIQESSIYDPDRAYAQIGGDKYPLTVGTLSGGYALDWLPRTQEGETVTIVFGYFSTNRIIEKTTSSTYGELGVLNWAPAQWSKPVDYEAVQVIYPIILDPTWFNASTHGVYTTGADAVGYVEDANQGLWSDSSRFDFDEINLLAYPYDVGASPRNFTVSMEHSNLLTEDHFRVFHYTNWSYYAPFLESGALGVSVVSFVNANAETQFDVEVGVSMTLPDNVTLVSGDHLTYIGSLAGGEIWYITYSFVPDNIPEIRTLGFAITADNLNLTDSLFFGVDIYIQEYIPPLIDPNLLFLGFAGFVTLGVVYYGYSRVTRVYGAKWDADETTTQYESPEIAIQTFGAEGTVAELDPIESAFFVNTTRHGRSWFR